MKAERLAGLEPQQVFAYFEKLCSMPHGSDNTKQISDYFVSFAKEHGLRCIQDALDNVILFKDASAGYEDHEPVILQAHMDMVCRKEEGSTVDMQKDPIDVTHDGTYVFARGTSLGGDDGAGVAMVLAVLADKTLAHPPLEVIFTAGEENGMSGVRGLDVSMLKGRRLWNLDMLWDTAFTAGCAGSGRAPMEMPVVWEPCGGKKFSIVLDSLHGGHSGSLIKMNYANANKAMAELLGRLQPLRLISLSGGGAGNAIPESACAVFVSDAEPSWIDGVCREFLGQLMQTYDEPTAKLTVKQLPEQPGKAMSAETTEKVIGFIRELPNGVQSWSPNFEGLPQTSLNIGMVETGESVKVLAHTRSSVNDEKRELLNKLQAICDAWGAVYREYGVNSAWEYRENSPFRDCMLQVYEKLFGKRPTVNVVHAGLECGVLSEKLPGLDCLSVGPTCLNVHTTQEKMDIASVGRMWKFLLEVLKAL